jgi:hypothetical protein
MLFNIISSGGGGFPIEDVESLKLEVESKHDS